MQQKQSNSIFRHPQKARFFNISTSKQRDHSFQQKAANYNPKKEVEKMVYERQVNFSSNLMFRSALFLRKKHILKFKLMQYQVAVYYLSQEMNSPLHNLNYTQPLFDNPQISSKASNNIHVRSLSRGRTRKNSVVNIDSTPKAQPLRWEEQKLPVPPLTVLSLFGHILTCKEKEDIIAYENIYYIGQNAQKDFRINARYTPSKENGEFQFIIGDQIAFRYEILQKLGIRYFFYEKLGKGSFGLVLKCYDHKIKVIRALKIIKNKKRYYDQAIVEIKILKHIQLMDRSFSSNTVSLLDYFNFRSHMCLVFELLSLSLYDYIKLNKFAGMQPDLIRRIAIQILQSLAFLKKHTIIHCDLKPENILFKLQGKSGIKLIDFGSSCFKDEILYTYIQSRFYRAPEVILGRKYNCAIDMWSFGCVIGELCNGRPLFPGETEIAQLEMVIEYLGMPPDSYLEKCSKRKLLFEGNTLKQTTGRVPMSRSAQDLLKCSSDQTFISFLSDCLGNWETRLTPEMALVHPWIIAGLPKKIKLQHLIQMKQNFPEIDVNEQLSLIEFQIIASQK